MDYLTTIRDDITVTNKLGAMKFQRRGTTEKKTRIRMKKNSKFILPASCAFFMTLAIDPRDVGRNLFFQMRNFRLRKRMNQEKERKGGENFSSTEIFSPFPTIRPKGRSVNRGYSGVCFVASFPMYVALLDKIRGWYGLVEFLLEDERTDNKSAEFFEVDNNHRESDLFKLDSLCFSDKIIFNEIGL